MKIKDLTNEQVQEIARLCYPFPEHIKSEIEVTYQPYDEMWYSDAVEYQFAKFQGITFADHIDTYRLWIYPNLDIEFDAIRKHPTTNIIGEKEGKRIGDITLLGRFPVRNQHKIQKKFIEWDIEPNTFNNKNK